MPELRFVRGFFLFSVPGTFRCVQQNNMTPCCQVPNYPIDALEREEIHPTYTGSNNFTGSVGSHGTYPCR